MTTTNTKMKKLAGPENPIVVNSQRGPFLAHITSVFTRQPTALFFTGSAPAQTPLVEGSFAGPVAGETRR